MRIPPVNDLKGGSAHRLRNERHIPGEVAQDPPLLTLLFLP